MNHPCLYDEYQEAKDRVLFEGQKIKYHDKFLCIYWNVDNEFGKGSIHTFGKWRGKIKTIEDLTDLGLTLTPNAAKQF
jgi:hypothetical protein